MTQQKPKRSILNMLFHAPFAALSIVVSFPITLLFATVLRGRCPNCQRRGLRGVLCCPEPAVTGDDRSFFLSDCDYCHHQFWKFEQEEAVIHIPPTDPRYLNRKPPGQHRSQSRLL
jgi:hypothetical protein